MSGKIVKQRAKAATNRVLDAMSTLREVAPKLENSERAQIVKALESGARKTIEALMENPSPPAAQGFDFEGGK